MIKFTTNIKWLNFAGEMTIFSLIVLILEAITPLTLLPTVFFLLGLLTVYWENNYTTIYKKES